MKNKLKITWDYIFKHTQDLAVQIKQQKFNHTNIVAISRGGLIPARLMADFLNIRRIYTIGIAMYEEQNKHKALIYQTLPQIFQSETGKTLVIDDISDKGESFTIAIKELEKFKQPTNYHTCSLFTKKSTAFVPNYYIETIDDNIWVEFPWEI